MKNLDRRNFFKKSIAASAAASVGMGVYASQKENKPEPAEKLVFPKDFLFGAGTAAYQIEGGWNEDGKGESNWDRFTHNKGNTKYNADVACDHYHRWKEDVGIMKQLNLQVYRFSTAWSRILPEGKGKVNQKGLDFYKNLIDELLKNNIKPALTLFHWDLPQKLQDIGGWANREIAEYYQDYAALMFKELGDKVPIWTTHNEPWVFTIAGHTYGKSAPGIRDQSMALLTTLNALRAHGKAVSAFRSSGSKGKIGITLSTAWTIPDTQSEDDKWAANIMRRSHIEWFADPIFKGEYPADVWEVYKKAGVTMPEIQAGDMESIKVPIDFLGLNYYGPSVVRKNPSDYWPYGVTFVSKRNDLGSNEWNVDAFRDLLHHADERYNHPDIIITENGRDGKDFDYLDKKKQVADVERIDYTYDHIKTIHKVIQEGVKMKGYFHWSFIDNFEWGDWSRCGLVYRDYATNERFIKNSGKWYADCIKKGYFYYPY